MRVKGRAKFESESRHLYSCVLATETKSKAEKAGSKETWNPKRYLCHDICLTYKQDKKTLVCIMYMNIYIILYIYIGIESQNLLVSQLLPDDSFVLCFQFFVWDNLTSFFLLLFLFFWWKVNEYHAAVAQLVVAIEKFRLFFNKKVLSKPTLTTS